MLTAEQKKKKQRLIRYVIGFCALLIPLLGYIQSSLLKGDFNLPISSTVLIFALININGLLLLLMLYLVLRNLVELIFERKQKILGSRLRTRLVISFISLSMVPTAILFFVALRFVSTSMDYWFNSNVEDSLQASLKLAQSIFHDTEKRAENMGRQIGILLENGTLAMDPATLKTLFTRAVEIAPPGAPDALTLIDSAQKKLVSVRGPRLLSIVLPEIPSEALRLAHDKDQPEVLSQKTGVGELIQAIVPVRLRQGGNDPLFLVASVLIPSDRLARMQAVSDGITDYRQLVMLKAPIKLSLIIMLIIITLLIIFGAIWFGFYIARSLTGPINKLAQATRRVADGDLDFVLEKESDDEMGLLVDSFNRMTADIQASNRQLAEAHQALQESTMVSEQRRRYLETILENVAAGVIAINENNEITTINRFAEELLKIEATSFLGHDFHQVLGRPHVQIMDRFLEELNASGKHSIERHLRLTVRRGETLSLQVNITRMVDEQQQPIGYVIVFDNLTKLEKAQRLAAWQEVARRIAHEIKNPLTPIQLSAQRLRKRYLDRITEDREVFDQCTRTVVKQVDEIKRLVSEFSDFARMPRVKKKPGNLAEMARDTLVLYKEGHKHITFTLDADPDIPVFSFDPVQIKRVLINLLDNAVGVMPEGGEITITLSCNRKENTARMTVADTGPGITEQVKLRLFEPYFSTRKSGTGLGLAITHTIVTEHNGTIRVLDNKPTGTVFTVELPLDT
ncbi:MAG TPA: HAMP domain-containing protein [Desulfobulbus sp.]|nr:HAMP domain-containing protein [Desulfobulbus sp.]